MKNAYPADELMPLTCKGRTRGRTPSRGDVDDALGNFQLTLVDALGSFGNIFKACPFAWVDLFFKRSIRYFGISWLHQRVQ